MTQQIIVVHQTRRASCKKVCCIFTSSMVFTIALVVFVLGCVMVVRPYSHEKTLKETMCNSSSVSWDTEDGLKCNCHTEYDDKEICTEGDFPCLNIQTVYKDENGQKHTGKLYESYSGMDSDAKCSYPACNAYDRSYEMDIPGFQVVIKKNQDVLNFASEHGVGSLYTCYYNPSNYNEVISEKQYTTLDAFNLTFWPLLVMVVTVVLTVVVLRLRRNDGRNGVEFNRFY